MSELINHKRFDRVGRQKLSLAMMVGICVLIVYSAILLGVEWSNGQTYVRQYFTDIEGDVKFYAVNTTLSSGMLAASGLLCAFLARYAAATRTARMLFAGQAAFCLWSAADDRFQFHEAAALWAGTGDGYIMASIAVANAIWYAVWFRPRNFNMRMAVLLFLAAAFYVVMLFFDTSMPHDMLWRLSIEDLCKTWSSFCFFTMSWEALRFHTYGLPVGEASLVLPWGLDSLWQSPAGSGHPAE